MKSDKWSAYLRAKIMEQEVILKICGLLSSNTKPNKRKTNQTVLRPNNSASNQKCSYQGTLHNTNEASVRPRYFPWIVPALVSRVASGASHRDRQV